MSTGVDHVLPATRTAPKRGRLGRGRTWILATGDPRRPHRRLRAHLRRRRPPRPAAAGLGADVVPRAARRHGRTGLARDLHGLRALRGRRPADLGLELRRGAEHLPRDARRVARVPDPLAGRPLSLRLVGVHGRRGGALHQRLARPRAGAARLDPLVGLPAGHGAPPHADRGRRRRGSVWSTASSARIPSTASRSSGSSRPRRTTFRARCSARQGTSRGSSTSSRSTA